MFLCNNIIRGKYNMICKKQIPDDILNEQKEKERNLEKCKSELERLFSQNANKDNLEKAKEIFEQYKQLCNDEETSLKEYYSCLEIEIKLIAYELSTKNKLEEKKCTRAIVNYNRFFNSLDKDLSKNEDLDEEEKTSWYLECKSRIQEDIIKICKFYCETLFNKIKDEKNLESRNSLFCKNHDVISIIQKYEEYLNNTDKQKLHLYIAEENVLYGKTEKALIEYDNAIKFNPNDFYTSNRKAIYFYKLGKYTEIENIYNSFLRSKKLEKKSKFILYCNLSKTFIALNNLKKAKYYIDKAKKIINNNTSKKTLSENQIDKCEALYYFKKGKYRKASECYEKLQNEPYYKRKYGVSLIRENIDLNKGNDLIRESIEIELNNNIIENIPKSLYIYRKLDKNTIFTILNGHLAFSNPKNFNDPLDTKFIIDNTKDTEVKEILKKFKIRCFSGGEATDDKNTEPLNTLMWSHYADEHKGIAIEYDFTNLKKHENGFYFTKVDYSNTIVPNMEIIEQTDYIKSFFTKDELWKYENEYRLITFEDNLDFDENLENKFKCNLDKIGIKIKSITFGFKAEDKDAFQELIRSKIPNCEFYKIEIMDKKMYPFKLVRNRYEAK